MGAASRVSQQQLKQARGIAGRVAFWFIWGVGFLAGAVAAVILCALTQ